MAQKLADRCRHSFAPDYWQGGIHDYAVGAVKIAASDESGAQATVEREGSRPYQVSLDWELAAADALLIATCTCPNYCKGDLCEHIAATIFEIDRQGLSNLTPGRGTLDVIDEYGEWEAGDEFRGDLWRAEVARRQRSTKKSAAAPPRAAKKTAKRAATPPKWQSRLQSLAKAAASIHRDLEPAANVRGREIWYRLNPAEIADRGALVIDFHYRDRKLDGEFGKRRPLKVDPFEILSLPDRLDREVLSAMIGNQGEDQYARESYRSNSYYGYTRASSTEICRCQLAPAAYALLLPRLCASGRFDWLPEARWPEAEEPRPLTWDDGPCWQFKLQFGPSPEGTAWRLKGVLHRPDGADAPGAVRFADAGVILFEQMAARLDENAAPQWIMAMQKAREIEVPAKEREAFLKQLGQTPDLPPLELAEQCGWKTVAVEPTARLVVASPERYANYLKASVSFDYRDQTVAWRDRRTVLVDEENRELIRRDSARERAALTALHKAPVQQPSSYRDEDHDAEVAPKRLPLVVSALIAAGWRVEAEGVKMRQAGQFKVSLASGIDWFELEAAAEFDGISVGLPELLKALERGQSYVELGDGSRGILPEEWLARYAPLADMGTVEQDKIRFVHSQAMLLDAWLAAQPDVDVDATFERIRDRLRSFEGIKPADEPVTFHGRLRGYQREGLGWLRFLDEFGFGGCLADDMGLGKTVQVLALLDSQRSANETPANDSSAKQATANGTSANGTSAKGTSAKAAPAAHAPSLVVAPRSLIHNWIAEAQRFTPQLRVLDYTGQGRAEQHEQFAEHDLVITTYGTLRRDIARLKDIEFEYCVLDEAQSIKNADSHSAKACRLLRAKRRLAMTGTPIENHLGELWSIFEFLNPGMLGRSAALKRLAASSPDKDPAVFESFAKGLRPFMLRRTKAQVLSELPEKTEQTLYCELEHKQRKLYDELRSHYRDLLAKRIDAVGLNQSKIQVLEALLRLRQAACHPGLIDPKKSDQPSAKLEALLEQLDEVLSEGHKALVFSQFTSLLAIVRKELDRRQIVYEYLDGKTRDRQQRVERFQQDPQCPLFLISLKAGGLGLNLTAADYVFILDPWWNPAVEAQAIDRAHRIGQNRRVFAYRLIARDTVEEKILDLQRDKKKLAEAIISADNSLISSLTADDLQWLLS
ncbi:MAG TPA: SNF2-related protein [Pirellulales bacterium]|nr:SNF2-related protein [Pirellulales bacterium]